MKKAMVLFMSILLAVTLAAYGSQDNGNSSQDPRPAGGSSTPESTEGASQQQSETLVVYYSASGNTETAAGYIADAVNGELFELVPTEPYSDADLDWTDESSRVTYEHDIQVERYTIHKWYKKSVSC